MQTRFHFPWRPASPDVVVSRRSCRRGRLRCCLVDEWFLVITMRPPPLEFGVRDCSRLFGVLLIANNREQSRTFRVRDCSRLFAIVRGCSRLQKSDELTEFAVRDCSRLFAIVRDWSSEENNPVRGSRLFAIVRGFGSECETLIVRGSRLRNANNREHSRTLEGSGVHRGV